MSERTQAFVNFYAAMGALEKYLELVPEAQEFAKQHDVSIRFLVKDGPDGVVDIKGGACKVYPYEEGMSVKVALYFDSCEKFNKLVAGENVMPLPIKGVFKVLKLMAKPDQWFNVLTTKMAELMRKTEFKDEEEKKTATSLAFYAMVLGAVQVGNIDSIGQHSMKRTVDGEISIGIKDIAYGAIIKKDGKFTASLEKSKAPRAIMEFADIDTANGIINGTLDSMSCISSGKLDTKGHMLMLDNFNKIANILPKYLS